MKPLKQPLATDPQALSYIGIIIRTFEPLHFMNLSDQDREATLKARQALEAIVKANGYTVSYRTENTIKKAPLKDKDIKTEVSI